MGGKLYFVELTDEERAELEALVSAGNHSAQKLTRARILLKSDKGWSDPKIADALDCGRQGLGEDDHETEENPVVFGFFR